MSGGAKEDPVTERASGDRAGADFAERASNATDSPERASSATSFSVAMQELESILERIDGDGIDIDQLAGELKRATELLEVCRGKIRKAEIEVNQIVEQLEDSDER